MALMIHRRGAVRILHVASNVRLLVVVLLFGLASASGGQGMPDLVLDGALLQMSVSFDLQSFAASACELQPIDLCVGGPGPRSLLRFSVLATNLGTADLVLGVPPMIEPPNQGGFVYSACHMHFHFTSFARYELRQRGTTTVVAPGQKRSFCVEDTRQVDPAAPIVKKYCCTGACQNLQGVQVGWGDLYPSSLPCQWIDVTGVAPGDYDLCVFLNTEGLLAEDPAGNEACVPVTLSAPGVPAPTVKVKKPHAGRKLRVGRRLAVTWKRRAHGELLFQEVWLSRDGGASYDRLARLVPPNAKHAVRMAITPELAGEQARIKVYVCARNPKDDDTGAGARQCGEAESGVFRIVP
jgi:hypothetical protein